MNHLFFSCQFSCSIWRRILRDFHPPQEWDNELQWLLGTGTGNGFRSRPRNLSLTCAVVASWRKIPRTKENWLLCLEWGFPQCIFDR
ncbi:hypothetical protein LIER_34490 [Lithospermum erythrorhizon]|uniref:Uncharacterized protein n=1 Tax=Lithospermum erythrorhizon TaxID=34254 RepID=A0AAV3S3A8_LITER